MTWYSRREIAFGGAAIAALAIAPTGRAQAARIQLSGSMKQGGLVIGRAAGAVSARVDSAPVKVSPDGIFTFGLEYDQTTPSLVAVGFSDGSSETASVAAVIRQYETQTINGLPEHLVKPTAEEQKRIDGEHARVAEARKTNSDATWFAEPFDWPADGIISGLFGSQRILNGVPSAPHFGVDIAAGEGAPIRACASATVLLADEFFLEGNFTLLDHGHGVFTSYMHQSKLLVKLGDQIERGQMIGRVGKTGRATGPHLHWGMNWFQVRLDPSLSTRLPAPTKA